MKSKRLLLLLWGACVLGSFSVQAQKLVEHSLLRPDSVRVQPWQPWLHTTPTAALVQVGMPWLGYNLLHYHQDVAHRATAHHFANKWGGKWDAYVIPLPLMTTWGMRCAGIKGYSDSWPQMLCTQALGAALAVGITTTGKWLVGRTRPDASNTSSFPSGHTTYAFASAAALDAEYGERYPALALAGYGVASGVALSRMSRDRHWATDVITGAGVGMASAYLAYWLMDRWHSRRREEAPLATPWHGNSPLLVQLGYGIGAALPYVPAGGKAKTTLTNSVSVRIPLLQHWGLLAKAEVAHTQLVKANQQPEHLHSYTLMAGASYFYAFPETPWALEGGVELGYESEGKLSSSSITPRADAIPVTAPGVRGQLLGKALCRLRSHTVVAIEGGYAYSPTARRYDRLHKNGLGGFWTGVGIAFLWEGQ